MSERTDQLQADLTFNREQYRVISTNLRFAAQRIDVIKAELAKVEEFEAEMTMFDVD